MNTQTQFNDPFAHLDFKKTALEDLSFNLIDYTVNVFDRYKTEQISMEQYKVIEALNQSTLKRAYKTPYNVDADYDQNRGMELGSVVDSIVSKTFNDEYIIGGEARLSDKMKDMIEAVYAIQKQQSQIDEEPISFEMSDKAILHVRDQFGWNTNYKDDTAITKFIEGGNKGTTDGIDYYKFLLKADGKNVVDQDTKEKADTIAHHVKDNYGDILSHCDRQVAYVGTISITTPTREVITARMKGLVDIDTPNNIYDLKIIGQDSTSFGYAYYLKYGYYIQDVVYYLLTGKPVSFLIANTIYPQAKCIRSIVHNNRIKESYAPLLKGFAHNNRRYAGLLDMLKDYKYYEANSFDVPAQIAMSPEGLIHFDKEMRHNL